MLESLFVPYLPVDDAYLTRPQVVVTAQASSSTGSVPKASTVKPDMILSDCDDVQTPDNPDGQLGGVLLPAGAVHNYWYSRYHKDIDVSDAKVVVIEGPSHGVVVSGQSDKTFGPYFEYGPKSGYLGADQVTFMVEVAGKRIKVVTKLYVVPIADSKGVHCFGDIKRISGNTDSGNSVYTNLSEDWLRSVGIDDTLARALSGVSLTFADLGNAVGQTVDEGGNATITLDDNAAGHGWFVDSTPGTNAEYIPTSNPNQWIAKAGTDAANKMDLLSVLLHEYGHALGIDHSADGNDFMAATLQPGVRRLPSSDELALMAQLVGEIKPALGLSNGAAQGNTPGTPLNPSLPVGTTLSALLLGRLRRTGYGSWSPLFDSAQVPAPVPQFAIAANAKLENTQFDGGTGWTTEGDVAFGNSPSSGFGAGAATLTETAASQTRLNQVFVLGEHDRFLSFNLANIALGDQAGPDDAFEVALLDANLAGASGSAATPGGDALHGYTGLSLLGGTGLSHNDAFLNIQANSLEHKASGITRIDNPDSSRTYLVDLAGIAAGTTVNLAFDLIGFGQGAEAGNSRITVRDLRLGVPQTADDSATLAEDTPAIIDALTNDLNARQPRKRGRNPLMAKKLAMTNKWVASPLPADVGILNHIE